LHPASRRGHPPIEKVLFSGAIRKAELGMAIQQLNHVLLHRGAGTQQQHAAIDAFEPRVEPAAREPGAQPDSRGRST
jgi:hypothetical protein